MSAPTEEERTFLRSGSRALARIATVDADGLPHVVPSGWSWDDAAGELVLGGRNVTHTSRARHVRDGSQVAVSTDGAHAGPGWSPWALLVRGPAYVDEGTGEIRVRPEWTRSWGLRATPE